MDSQFVISNIHGYLRSLDSLLGEWEPEEETLIIAGNVIDYGHNSFLVCRRLLELERAYPGRVIFLKGKHESFFEQFEKNPAILYPRYLEEGGLATIRSFSESGVTYEEMNDRYYMMDTVIPEIDFSYLHAYLMRTLERYETPSSVFLSHEGTLLDGIIPFGGMDSRKIFMASDEDPRFKLHYLNHYLPERLVREGKLQMGDLHLFMNRYVLLGKDPVGWQDAYLWGHHIQNGIVTELSQVPAEE